MRVIRSYRCSPLILCVRAWVLVSVIDEPIHIRIDVSHMISCCDYDIEIAT